MPLSSFLNYRFTSICKPFLILCFDLIAHPFGVSPLLSLVFHFFLPTSAYVHVPFFCNVFLLSIKVCHCCLYFPNIFSPQRPSALSLHSGSILLMLHVFPANMGHSYQHSLIALICCFLTEISELWRCKRIYSLFLQRIFITLPSCCLALDSCQMTCSCFHTSLIKIDQLSLEGHS